MSDTDNMLNRSMTTTTGRDVTLRNAVLDLDCSVGDGAHLVNMEGVVESNRLQDVGVVVRDGLVLVGKGAVVPPGARL